MDGLGYSRAVTKKLQTLGKPRKLPRSYHPGADRHPYTDLQGMKWARDKRGDWWLTVRITPKLLNPNRVLHGGVLFTLADTAMGRLVTSSLHSGEECASIEVRIHHLRMVSTGILRAQAQVLHRGRRIIVLEAEVLDKQGRLISKASGTMVIIGKHSRPPAR